MPARLTLLCSHCGLVWALCGLVAGWTPSAASASDLLDAVMAEDLAGVTAALATGADVQEVGPSAMTALHMAAARGAVDIGALLIGAGAAVESSSGDPVSQPLHLAAQYNKPDFVKLLLDNGASPDLRDGRGNTALILAAKDGSVEVAKLLLAAGADPLIGDTAYGDSALYLAAMHGRLEVVRLLIGHGVDVNLRNPKTGETALWVAAMDNRLDVLNFLLAEGADPNIPDATGKVPMNMTSSPKVKAALAAHGAEDH
jgi:ankyrin repeat protein